MTWTALASISIARFAQSLPPLLFGYAFLPSSAILRAFHLLVLAVQDRRPSIPGQRGEFVPGVGLGELLECGFVARSLVLAKGVRIGELQPGEIGVQKCRLVLILFVEGHHILIELDCFDLGRIGVGRLRRPLEEVVGRSEHRAVRGQLERVFGASAACSADV